MAINQAQLQELQEIHKCNFLLLVQANNFILGAMELARAGKLTQQQGNDLGVYIKFIEKQVSDWKNNQRYYEKNGVPLFDGKFFSNAGQQDLTNKANALIKIVSCKLSGAAEDLKKEFEKYNFTPSVLDWLIVPWNAAALNQVEVVRRIELARINLNLMIQKTQESCSKMGLTQAQCQEMVNKNLTAQTKAIIEQGAGKGENITDIIKWGLLAALAIFGISTLSKTQK